LWDKLSIPHKLKKQVFGPIIPVIGIDVDPNAMTLTLAPQKRIDLCDALYSWAIKPIGKSKCHYRLKDWQQMAGWVIWALNVFLLLCPCLNTFYSKMSGSHIPTHRIWVNNSVREDLIWAARHIESSSGVHILQAASWDLDTADLVAYCDACPEGMGFWYPLAEHGIPPSIIQPLGRWSSATFLIYIRKSPALIQALLYSDRHASKTTSTASPRAGRSVSPG